MPYKFEQFIKFTTDSVGLERTFRLIQSIVQILSYFSIPFDLLLYTLSLSSGGTPSSSAVRSILKALNQRLGLVRRSLRLFRFLESFDGAHKLYYRLSSAEVWKGGSPRGTLVKLEPWLDVFARTFNGMYLLLEASTFADALQIPGLRVWAPEWEDTVAVEAQRFWLFALVCGMLYNLLEIPLVLSFAPLPELEKVPTEKSASGEKQEGERVDGESPENLDGPEFREWQRNRVKEFKERSRLRRRQVVAKVRKLGRTAAANALDILLPGTFVGWIKVEPGTVSMAMFVTTILTSMDAWERCGREVSGNKSVGPPSLDSYGSFAFPRKP